MAVADNIIDSFITYAENSTSFSASFLQEVVDLIVALGVPLTTGDDDILCFAAEYVEQEIRNSCNVSEVPEGLWEVAIHLIVARFLTTKKGKLSQEDLEALDFTPMLKELSEGDTKQVWDTNSGLSVSQRLDLLITLFNQGKNQFVTFRRLKW